MLWWWRCRTVAWWYEQVRPRGAFLGRFVVCGLAHVGSMYVTQPAPMPVVAGKRLCGPAAGHPERLVSPRLVHDETKRLTEMVLR
jgi:hypothetical protein